MKHNIIFLIVITFITYNSYAQITTAKIEIKPKVKLEKVYDGKSNFEEFQEIDGYKQYIGQKIYTTKNYSSIYFSTGEYCNDYYNKYFTIKNVTQKKLRLSNDSEMQVCDVLELINDKNGETYYYELGKSHISGGGWIKAGIQPSIILVPYFLHLKKTYENKKYVMVSYWRRDGFINEATNEWVVVDKKLYGGEWSCEVSVVEKDGKDAIFYIMKSVSGEIISSETINDGEKFSIIKKLDDYIAGGLFFMSVEDYNNKIASSNKEKKDAIAKNNNRIDKLTQKYGKEKAVLIVKGKVEIGMTKEMCKESWGIPLKTDVEKTKEITKETFIYGWSKRLNFENGKLVKIQY